MNQHRILKKDSLYLAELCKLTPSHVHRHVYHMFKNKDKEQINMQHNKHHCAYIFTVEEVQNEYY